MADTTTQIISVSEFAKEVAKAKEEVTQMNVGAGLSPELIQKMATAMVSVKFTVAPAKREPPARAASNVDGVAEATAMAKVTLAESDKRMRDGEESESTDEDADKGPSTRDERHHIDRTKTAERTTPEPKAGAPTGDPTPAPKAAPPAPPPTDAEWLAAAKRTEKR